MSLDRLVKGGHVEEADAPRVEQLWDEIRLDLGDLVVVRGNVGAFFALEPANLVPVVGNDDEFIRIVWRSEERRVGKECSELCRSRWSPYH